VSNTQKRYARQKLTRNKVQKTAVAT